MLQIVVGSTFPMVGCGVQALVQREHNSSKATFPNRKSLAVRKEALLKWKVLDVVGTHDNQNDDPLLDNARRRPR